MDRIKLVFHALYLAYLVISVLLFVFKKNVYEQVADLSLLIRFVEFWLVLGFFFMVSMWIIQIVNLRFLRKDKDDLKAEMETVKSRLYDLNRNQTNEPAANSNEPNTLSDTTVKE